MRRPGALALVVTLLLAPRMAGAQVGVIEAKYHGGLSIRRASGTIDRDTGSATLHVPRWTALLSQDTNGIFPAEEGIMVSLRLNEDNFTLEPGALKASRNGRVFSYRAKRGAVMRGLTTFRIWLRRDGSYGIRFTLVGIELSILKREDPICVPLAVIVGDDDFFNGASITSPTFTSPGIVVPSSCTVSDGDWPWARG